MHIEDLAGVKRREWTLQPGEGNTWHCNYTYFWQVCTEISEVTWINGAKLNFFFLFPERAIILPMPGNFIYLVCDFAVPVDRNLK